MTKEQEKNLHFVKLVEMYPCLYDVTLDSYSWTDVKERAWEEISNTTGDSVQTCKERWKNLRTVFLRHVKQKDISGLIRRKYYLEDAMQFILPFLKSNLNKKMTSLLSIEMENFTNNSYNDDEEDEVLEEVDDKSLVKTAVTCTSAVVSSTPTTDSIPSTASVVPTSIDMKQSLNYWSTLRQDANKSNLPVVVSTNNSSVTANCVDNNSNSNNNNVNNAPNEAYKYLIEYFESKKKNAVECADQKFLLSLLPDIKQMNSKQKRMFKRKVLEMIEEIFDEPVNRPSTYASNVNNISSDTVSESKRKKVMYSESDIYL